MLHMQQQGDVQHVGFQLGVFLVGAEHLQQVFGGGKLRFGAVDVHAAAALIIMVGVVAVDGQHGEDADELDALLQLGLQVGPCRCRHRSWARVSTLRVSEFIRSRLGAFMMTSRTKLVGRSRHLTRLSLKASSWASLGRSPIRSR